MARPKGSIAASSTPEPRPPTPITVPLVPFAPQPADLDRATSMVGMHGSFVEFEDAETTSSQRTYTALTRTGVALPAGVSPATPSLIAEGAVVLERLHASLYKDHDAINEKFKNDDGECQWGDQFMGQPAWNAAYGAIIRLGPTPPPDELRAMSRSIFEATAQNFEFPTVPHNDALGRALSGRGLRWESVALFAAHMGGIVASGENSKALVHRLWVTSTKCQSFWEYLGQVNDLTFWAMLRIAHLATWCFGDDSYYAWQAMGNVCSVIYALNFHKGFADDASVPSYVVELRRRAVALAHETDKQASTFVGRPPRLNRHSFVVDMPLDVDDDVFTTPQGDFERARADLDQDGWAKSGRLNAASRLRAQYLLTLLREEVLELSLGRTAPDQRIARDILQRLVRTWHSMPVSRYDGCRLSDLEYTTSVIVRWLQLDYLFSKFLLHKMLVNHVNSSHPDLIQVSHEILSLMLQNVRDRNTMTLRRSDLEYGLVFYAMPCASILLLELYRVSRQPQQQTIPVSRSTIIKDLSALIAACDWLVEEGQGNSDLCKKAQSIFSRGLDRILDNSFTPSAPRDVTGVVEKSATQQQPTPTEMGVTDGFIDDQEWTAWLESYGLQGEQWLDFSFDGREAFPDGL